LPLPPSVDASPEYHSDTSSSSQADLDRRHPSRLLTIRQGTFEAKEDEQVRFGASVGQGSKSARQTGARIRRPPALPKGIEAESGDEIGA
jgi:hypothetical protein